MGWVSMGDKEHWCKKPGWWARRKAGAEYAARWRCDECGRLYEWRSGYGGDMSWYWIADTGPKEWEL
jgi:hypothetical protein